MYGYEYRVGEEKAVLLFLRAPSVIFVGLNVKILLNLCIIERFDIFILMNFTIY